MKIWNLIYFYQNEKNENIMDYGNCRSIIEYLGPRGRGQGPEGVSYRLPPVSENKRDEGFILLLSYWSIIHEIGGGIRFSP